MNYKNENRKQQDEKGKINKVTRGYRLKPKTHRLISMIQKMLNSDQDGAIAAACIAFFAELQKDNEPEVINPEPHNIEFKK